MFNFYYKKTGKLSRSEQSEAAYELLAEKLSTFLGEKIAREQIRKDNRGCPFLENRKDIFVSVTHTHGLVACAFADSPVGIDAEPVGTRRKTVENRVFTENEISLIDSSENTDYAFFMLWTLKESYLKAIGTGFSDNAKSIEFSCLGNRAFSDKKAFSFTVNKFENFVISVCLKMD